MTGILVIIVVMRLGAAWGGMVMISLVALGSVYSWKLFTEQGLLISPLYPVLTTTAVFVIASMTSYLQSESSRREVKGAFGRYMSPAVLDRLAKNPKKNQPRWRIARYVDPVLRRAQFHADLGSSGRAGPDRLRQFVPYPHDQRHPSSRGHRR